MKKIQAIFSDFDGTIINRKGNIDPVDIELMHELKKSGVTIVGTTGRHFTVARCYALKIGIENPFILCNGGIVYNFKTESAEECHPLDNSLIAPMVEFIEKEGIEYQVYLDNGIYLPGDVFKEDITRILKQSGEYFRAGEIFTDSNGKFSLEGKNVIKLFIPDCTVEFREKLLNYGALDATKFVAVFSGGTYLDINSVGINKGKAMLEYCKKYNIDPSATIALGDNFNDVEMLQNAGIAISPENAADDVKKLANIVTSDCDNKPFTNAIRLVRAKYGDII